MKPARRVAILGGVRIPFVKNNTAYFDVGNVGMSITTLGALVEKFGLQGETLGEVAMGAVLKHSSDWNLAREATLSSGLSPQTPGITLQRACGTGLDSVVAIGNKIALGQIDAGIAAGTDTISDVPIVYPDEYREILLASARGKSFGDQVKPWLGLRPSMFKPVAPGVTEPRTKLSMGQSTEITAKQWNITRADQDQLAMESHHKAAKAWAEGFYKDLVVPFSGATGDNNIRADTSLEKLGKLKPVFDRGPQATMTAGNSTPLTDGAASVLLASEEWAKARGLPVQAYLRYGKVAAVDFVKKEEIGRAHV